MYDDILVPTDGSRDVDGVIARAFDFARTWDATVHVLSVIDTGSEPRGLKTEDREELRERLAERGREATERIQEEADDAGLEAVRAVREGTPHREILAYVEEANVDLIVMGTHGREAARSRVGSVTERVITFADVPVMAVPLAEGADGPEGAYDHVVIPTDGSDAAGRAADHGLAIAQHYGADVHTIYVVDTTTYSFEDAPRSIVGLLKEGGKNATDEIAADARERDLSVTTEILRGVPEDTILEYAVGIGADLIALGSRGRALTADGLLGSTAARVVGRADSPVLVVG